MSEYTREQVIDMATNVRDCAWPDDVKEYMVLIEPMLRAYAATLRQQGGPSLYVGTIDGCPVALHGTSESIARVRAALAQNTRGEPVGQVYRMGNSIGSLVYTDHGAKSDLPHGTPLYTHAERATVPADFRARLLDALNLYYRLGANGAENESAEDADALMLFLTAPSQPKGVQDGEVRS